MKILLIIIIIVIDQILINTDVFIKTPQKMKNIEEALPISVSEAYQLLEPLKSRYKNIRSESYQIYSKTFEYTEKFRKIREKSVLEDLKFSLSTLGLKAQEIAAICTLLPQSVNEAKICIPGVSELDDEVISQIIEKIHDITGN